ncbi:MAG: pantoate--beta-alanine ligase [Chloroflexaceae bacterium]|nr:pantoate--beta-alanine ligase [Chloroflexaceae bacterium]
MEIVEHIEAIRTLRPRFERLGLVPTMGYLHEGHLSLIRRARADCGAVAVSIFVNPTQFAPHEDLARYPRDLDHDLRLLRQEQVDLVFVPHNSIIYPPDFCTYVHVEQLTTMLEGRARPGFFRGVATVVCKLFNIIQPTHAYFGQKDAQQCVVVQQMVKDLNLPIQIIIGPTVREPDGLAMSSRNAYLSPTERTAATTLYRALQSAKELYVAGERNAESLRQSIQRVLAAEPLAQPEYISAADPTTLDELETIDERGVLLSLAVRIGPARLIDNILLPNKP